MRKILTVLLAALLIVQAGMFTAFADNNTGGEPQSFTIDVINIGKINTVWIEGAPPDISVELDQDMLDKVEIGEEKWFNPEGVEISGDNIPLKEGNYKYELRLNAKEGFVFDNDLKILYQGVEGQYNLHYDFPVDPDGQTDHHTMIVNGEFNNIISASPLIDKVDVGKLLAMVISGDYSGADDLILDDGVPFSEKATIDKDNSWAEKNVSDDSYSYQLVLETNKGFTFSNTLQFLYNGEYYGATLDFEYDLDSDSHKLTIKRLTKEDEDQGKGTDGTDLGPGASIINADEAIENMDSDSSPKGTVFRKLRLRSVDQKNNAVTLTWTKLSKADKYIIYGNRCGSSYKMKRLAVKTGNKCDIKKIGGKKLKKGTYYKFMIVALDSDNKVVSTSKLIHVATKGGKVCNYKKVSVSKTVVNKAKKLKRGKTLKLNVRLTKQSAKLKVKKHAAVQYETSNKSIAAVSKKGVITAKKKGTCYIYAYAQNGVYKRIKVVVR